MKHQLKLTLNGNRLRCLVAGSVLIAVLSLFLPSVTTNASGYFLTITYAGTNHCAIKTDPLSQIGVTMSWNVPAGETMTRVDRINSTINGIFGPVPVSPLSVLSQGDVGGTANAAPPDPFTYSATWIFTGGFNKSITLTLHCTPPNTTGTVNGDGSGVPLPFMDGRCNQEAWQSFAVYPDGKGGFIFYAIYQGVGYYAMHVTEKDLDNNPDTGVNHIIAQAQGVQLWRLQGGLLQAHRTGLDGKDYSFNITCGLMEDGD